MAHPPQEAVLVRSLEEYMLRVESGEMPDPAEYEPLLGSSFHEFLDAVEAKSALDALIEPAARDVTPEMVGPYRVVRQLGRGALGTVFEARHRRLDRVVALKLLHDAYLLDDDKRERFRREARLCAQFDHEHLVPMIDAGNVDGRPYCAMSLIEGRSLKSILLAGPAEATPELFREFAGLADGLDALHNAGIVHRDVKPSNVMVAESGRLVLTDFGLARSEVEATVTQAGGTIGTLPYLPPEAFGVGAQGGQAAGDVYALGVTLYEALAGRAAFAGEGAGGVIAEICKGRPRSLRALRPELSSDCERVVRKAMAARPSDRYASAAEFRDDLLRLAEGVPVEGRPPARGGRAIKRAAVLLAVCALVAGGWWIWYANRPVELVLQTYPSSQVFVDGRLLGETPLRTAVSVSARRLKFEREGFQSLHHDLRLEPGSVYPVAQALRVADPEDPEARRALLDALGLLDGYVPIEPHRGSGAGLIALWPRGKVRLAHLGSMHFQLPPLLPGVAPLPEGGTWVIRRGDEELWSQKAAYPEEAEAVIPFPPDVAARLSVGDEITWGYKSRRRKGWYATAQLVDDSEQLAAALRKGDSLFGPDRPVWRGLYRAKAYERAALHVAALGELEPLLKADLRPVEEALVRFSVHANLRRLRLRESTRSAENQKRVHALDPDVLSGLWSPKDAKPSGD